MKFHVARDGAVIGEFEEQAFRNRVFAGEIMPDDLYWRAGFKQWRPVAEFRVARKTEIILLGPDDLARPPAIRPRSTDLHRIGIIATAAVVALLILALLTITR